MSSYTDESGNRWSTVELIPQGPSKNFDQGGDGRHSLHKIEKMLRSLEFDPDQTVKTMPHLQSCQRQRSANPAVPTRWGFARGTLGGTQYRNTVRKNGKHRNTSRKIFQTPIPHTLITFIIGSACLWLLPSSAFNYLRLIHQVSMLFFEYFGSSQIGLLLLMGSSKGWFSSFLSSCLFVFSFTSSFIPVRFALSLE